MVSAVSLGSAPSASIRPSGSVRLDSARHSCAHVAAPAPALTCCCFCFCFLVSVRFECSERPLALPPPLPLPPPLSPLLDAALPMRPRCQLLDVSRGWER